MSSELTEQGAFDEDWRLLDRIHGGDQRAMEVLFDRYSSLVYAVSLRVLGDPSAAEDIVQETFLRIWRTPPALASPNGGLAGWFAVLARNRAIDQLRRRKPTEDPAEVVLLSPLDVAAESERNLLLARAQEMITQLPGEQQDVLQLAFFDGLTHAEIATRLGSPLGTIKTRLRRAVLTLRKAAQA